jgi:hypothetical protein
MTTNYKAASIFRRIYDGVLEAREREANRHMERVLSMMDQNVINERGLKRDRKTGQRFHIY